MIEDLIRDRLKRVSDDLSLHSAAPPSQIEEVFNFNARQMEAVSPQVLSQ
jgi:hypothetical protein